MPPLPGSESWQWAYETGRLLDEAFPGQDAVDFAYAASHNDMGPMASQTIAELKMLTQGVNDGGDWVWAVRFEGSDRESWQPPTWWLMYAVCDYTGWDCQSYNKWFEVNP